MATGLSELLGDIGSRATQKSPGRKSDTLTRRSPGLRDIGAVRSSSRAGAAQYTRAQATVFGVGAFKNRLIIRLNRYKAAF